MLEPDGLSVTEAAIPGAERQERSNSLFAKTELINELEFEKAPRSFNFNYGNDETGSKWFLRITDGHVQVGVGGSEDIQKMMTEEEMAMYGVEDEGKTLVYPKMAPIEEELYDEDGDDGEYRIDGMDPRVVEIANEEELAVEPEILADMIAKLDPSELMIYTGAGISMGGEQPVWGMQELSKQLGLVENPEGNDFDELFRSNPEKLIEVAKKFGDSLFADVSTDAHISIAKLVAEMPGVLVLTENMDLKHEAVGSRLGVTHMGNKSAFGEVIVRGQATKVLWTIGLSHDDRGVLAYLKQENPDLQIIAIDQKKPNYLGSEDGLLKGDCQKVMPELVENVIRLRKENEEHNRKEDEERKLKEDEEYKEVQDWTNTT